MTEDQIEELRHFVARNVTAGYEDAGMIENDSIDYLGNQAGEPELRAVARTIIAEEMAKHLAVQSTWPDVTDCDRLTAAFDELEALGVVARQDFACCHNCGNAEIQDEIAKADKPRGYTFFHFQDTERAVEGHGLMLAYGPVGAQKADAIGHEIVDVLTRHGLEPEWNGDVKRRIHLPMDWKRRR